LLDFINEYSSKFVVDGNGAIGFGVVFVTIQTVRGSTTPFTTRQLPPSSRVD
ncbi:unnamed protein product, partial [Adineta steineri]